ncbi:energy transducer TonB [Fulvivirga lutea]|uniref:Energy transducer TonB n=1 Tax=Fulvivirga lutea TaxID=2810512 RepID=A0A974WJ40_9BACT|nr:energy transducer TonB [Fulvivirga lutea]QSE98708.1 energy transducer TonB [Fulvivirga lutea]
MKTKFKHIFLTSLLLVGPMVLPHTTIAQNDDKSYQEIEETQNDIEKLYVEVHRIIDEYPEATYSYVYDDGTVTEVVIDGIPNNRDRKQLEVYLIDLEEMKDDINNTPNRVGVYYAAETEPKPKIGMEKFYNELHSNLTYPEDAKELAVEGTVYVKFIVDRTGNVENVIASEDLEAPGEWVVKAMKKEAIKAVKETSGEWKPAEIADIPVAQWVVLPVQFKIENPYYTPVL